MVNCCQDKEKVRVSKELICLFLLGSFLRFYPVSKQ